MKKGYTIIMKSIVTVIIIIGYILIYVLDIKIIKDKEAKGILKIILGILFFPALILIFDMWDLFEKLLPNIYYSMTDKYDMLAFMGAYLSTIISSVLLIIITSKDREENTKIIQYGQRPYLDVRFVYLKKEFFNEEKRNNTVFTHPTNNLDKQDVDDYIAIEIINQGESVAIIDINNLKLEIKYNNIEDGNVEKTNIIEPKINAGITRLTLGKGQTVTIVFLYKEIYEGRKIYKANISYSKVMYKDLFNKQYIDECITNDKGEQEVIQDNKEIIKR